MHLSEKLADYQLSITYDELPEEVVHFTKLCILDYFGSALAGVDEPPIQMIAKTVNEMGGHPQATLLTGGKSSVLNVALVNGASSHIVELDDIHKSSIIHAATVVIPAALAVAEWKKLSGQELIVAVVVGYEICFRIGEAVSPSHYYYWHNTATCGTFGSAAAVAKLLQLDKEGFINTLGNAGSQAAGLWEFIEDGAMTKQLHPGKAAMNGMLAALLAKKEFTGARKILEGERGFFKAMSDAYDERKITQNLGQAFKILENSFKLHASCRHTHPAIDLALHIVNENNVNPEAIESVNVGTYRATIAIADNPNPSTIYASKFSTQFCIALALVNKSARLADFDVESLSDETIRELMGKVTVVLDSEIDSAYPMKWGSKVTITLKDGTTFSEKTDYPKGDPENPVTLEELKEKFTSLAHNLDEKNKKYFIDQVLELEQIEDIGTLMSFL